MAQEKEKQAEALKEATKRAEQAEAELERWKAQSGRQGEGDVAISDASESAASESKAVEGERSGGEAELRNDSMMSYLLDSLAAGKNIGHYGRLVFAMVARHFLSDEELLGWLRRDRDFGEEEAKVMIRQVEGRDYNPPKRERILEWQAEQEFPILPDPDDPDCGNLYRSLKFPDAVYEHIERYQEQKAGV